MDISPILQSHENQKVAGRGQLVSTDPVYGYGPRRKPDNSTRSLHLPYSNIHSRTCPENPAAAAYLSASKIANPQQGCLRYPAGVITQPTQSSQIPTHPLLSNNQAGNIQFPLANHSRVMSEMSDEEWAARLRRRVQLQMQHHPSCTQMRPPNPYVTGGYTQRGNGVTPTPDFQAEYARLPDRLASFNITNSGIHGRYGPEGVPQDSDRASNGLLQSRAHGRKFQPIAGDASAWFERHSFGAASAAPVTPTNAPPGLQASNAVPKKGLNEEIKETQQQQALDELEKLERGKDSRGRYVTRQGEGYEPPFPTPNYSPISSPRSSLSSMSELSSVASEDSSEEESEGEYDDESDEESEGESKDLSQNIKPDPSVAGSQDGNTGKSWGRSVFSSAYQFPQERPNNAPVSSLPINNSDTKSPSEAIQMSKAPIARQVAPMEPFPVFSLWDIPPITATEFEVPTLSEMLVEAPTRALAHQKVATIPALKVVASIPTSKVATSAQIPKADPSTSAPAPKSQVSVTQQIESREVVAFTVKSLLNETTSNTTSPEKSDKTPSMPTPSQTKENKVERSQNRESGRSKEPQVHIAVPSFPPPYPCNVIIPREGEMWIEDIDQEFNLDDCEVPLSRTAEDWEVVEESEIYEQDERDWKAVKQLDNDVAQRDRDEKKTRTYI
ncbi:hypothetical protein TWF506_008068 [Arthrobotrys conoides]|uniref:Uncharacterized protein n=1 Tax=Arthrobotrys conoides TaxID=74498 RepID=A0AAN8PF28_9PEZI